MNWPKTKRAFHIPGKLLVHNVAGRLRLCHGTIFANQDSCMCPEHLIAFGANPSLGQRGKRGRPFIEVAPDAEARRAALNIAIQTLVDAQWNVQKPLSLVDGLADGVSVQPSVPTFTGPAKGEIPNMSPYWHASDVAEKLLDFLHSYNWQSGEKMADRSTGQTYPQ
jgi:hypothetical protein